MLTTLNELGVPYVFVDVREVVRSRRGLYEVLSRALSDFLRRYSPYKALLSSFIGVLSGVRGVRVHGFEVLLNWGRDRPLLTELFREFDRVSGSVGSRFVFVIDEAQRLVGSLGVEVWGAVAHAYDKKNDKPRPSGRGGGQVLTTLKKYSIIDENLEFTDPIVREAAREL
ncbi:hypothetical protein Vsou_12750 [Vulcanisaeta souniana JCM 11219]|uniref:ATPase n=1 Tax=Vulcanisaeta souniana JCM 11219 TaxID=1293586 RepID=A0ABM8BML8_9CREN|nr:hypothetical protein Vsou_12750 [Vulcanisaeta souniana JCM 11219]